MLLGCHKRRKKKLKKEIWHKVKLQKLKIKKTGNIIRSSEIPLIMLLKKKKRLGKNIK